MFLISHRGNLSGPDYNNENKIDYILNAIQNGFDVEVDVHYYKDKFYLGHDEPTYLTSVEFLEHEKLWCHAKNIDAVGAFYKTKCHYFWHQSDDVTLTNRGYYWTYPGKKLFENSICVLPEKSDYKNFFCKGICSDYILKYKEYND
tara:strand:- start:113 stop:550 length:438 start_codon:yes stop_codon:yes gene_type:complete